ncbi:hypothetical protein PUV54_05940 [Hyphococcus flavus]|uniref:Uncharacterized protein n=1 Tax=Hyphococcus flavus TaxID=1866326 RepID=A0AAE9ZKA9_9PROT|nr:hypothetical protein [Hyphococcus flavus]WDI32736.1 hypothetical protein PUV54_05940 [Hyphococcus flavus]
MSGGGFIEMPKRQTRISTLLVVATALPILVSMLFCEKMASYASTINVEKDERCKILASIDSFNDRPFQHVSGDGTDWALVYMAMNDRVGRGGFEIHNIGSSSIYVKVTDRDDSDEEIAISPDIGRFFLAKVVHVRALADGDAWEICARIHSL